MDNISEVVLLQRWMKKDWFELAVMTFGQDHGSTTSVLALDRCVDPNHKSVRWEAMGGVMTLACILFGELVLRKRD